jgi:hypothetical protein
MSQKAGPVTRLLRKRQGMCRGNKDHDANHKYIIKPRLSLRFFVGGFYIPAGLIHSTKHIALAFLDSMFNRSLLRIG